VCRTIHSILLYYPALYKMETIEILIFHEELWHLHLLKGVSASVKNLTLTIRSKHRQEHYRSDDNDDTATASSSVMIEESIVDSSNLHAISSLIFQMPKLTSLQIYMEIASKIHIRSNSIQHLKFRGGSSSLSLDECMWPSLKSMDITIEMGQIHNGSIIKKLPPFVESLTLLIKRRRRLSTEDEIESESKTIGTMLDRDDLVGPYHHQDELDSDQDEELQNLCLAIVTMPHLKELNLLPCTGVNFFHRPKSEGFMVKT